MNVVGRVTVNMKPINRILKAKGLTAGGDVQRFHTANVLRRIQKYMPYRSGALIKQTIISSPINRPFIEVPGPTARYLYYGKAMVGKAPMTVTDKDLKYTKTKNPQAGPFWDRRLVAAEGKACIELFGKVHVGRAKTNLDFARMGPFDDELLDASLDL